MEGMSLVHRCASVSLYVGALSSLPQPAVCSGRVRAGPAAATSVLPGQEALKRAWSGAGAQNCFLESSISRRHRGELRSHACQGGDALNFGAALFILPVYL